MSCPFTPEQNGCAERKHRHIIETDLTLLFNAHMPSNFWPDAFLTAVYLPSKNLQSTSPWQKLFSSKPNYSTLKVFGSACYPWLRPYSQHKVASRTKQCVFIGYSLNYKGYKCLDVESGRIYFSRPLSLMKVIFPYKNQLPLLL